MKIDPNQDLHFYHLNKDEAERNCNFLMKALIGLSIHVQGDFG